MNSILFFDPSRDRWDTRRPDALRNRADPPSSVSILTVTWIAPPSGGSGSTTVAESESQATRVDRIIRENNTPTIIALAGVPRSFIQSLLTQQSIRQGYAFSSLEGDNGSCALLWKISFAVFFVEPKSKGFPCMLAHSRELFGAPAVISTAAFPSTNGNSEQLRELWDSYLGNVGQDTTTIACSYVGPNTTAAANVRAQLTRPVPVEAVTDGPHAIWFRAADGRKIANGAPLQNFGDRVTQVTLAVLTGGQSPPPSTSQTPVPSSIANANNSNAQQQQQQNQQQASARPNYATATSGTGAATNNNGQQQQNQQQRHWIIKNNCNIKVRENTVEILYDLSNCFGRAEDCIRALNQGDIFSWRSDFAICHGRLFACAGARADLGSFQRWMRENDPPITHSQRNDLIQKCRNWVAQQSQQAIGGGGAGITGSNNTSAAAGTNNPLSPPNPNSVQQAQQQAQQQTTAAQHLFGTGVTPNTPGISQTVTAGAAASATATNFGAASNAVAASNAALTSQQQSGTRYYRRGWTTNRAVLLSQVGPVELSVFDVTAELGVIPRPLPQLIDRLNGGGINNNQNNLSSDPLATYSRDYALCYCAERRGYWLVAAPNVPCDPLIARAVALQLKKQAAALKA